jgi:histone deacetylase 1/2
MVQLRTQLGNTKKKEKSMSEYFHLMKNLADTMASIGYPIGEEETASYILAGLGERYDSLVTSITVSDNLTLDDLYAHLVSYETRTGPAPASPVQEFSYSGNNAMRGGRGFGRGGRGRGRGHPGGQGGRDGGYRGDGGRGDGAGRGNGGGRGREKSTCQICGTYGHDALRCYSRFDHNIQPTTRSTAHASAPSSLNSEYYSVDPNWYMDSGATDHMTADLERLTTHDRYKGNDQVHVANGSGLNISHIGNSLISGFSRSLHLKNVLRVPRISKNLLSTHKLTLDNNAYVELHPYSFFIKDRTTKATILEGKCQGGLYPVPAMTRCQAFHTTKPSQDIWHRRLGHPSSQVVASILRSNKLESSSFALGEPHVCNACQQANARQLPFELSTRVSTEPLALVHSDVWGPAIKSSSRYHYYVSFLDDYSKFVWVYLLRHKSDVEKVFYQFQNRVERQLGTKIRSVQSDWGGEYHKLHQYFQNVGIEHRVSCPAYSPTKRCH